MLDRAIQAFLSGRRVVVGETVQAGWLVFRVADPGPPVKLEASILRAWRLSPQTSAEPKSSIVISKRCSGVTASTRTVHCHALGYCLQELPTRSHADGTLIELTGFGASV